METKCYSKTGSERQIREQQKIKFSLCMPLRCGGIAPIIFNLNIRWR